YVLSADLLRGHIGDGAENLAGKAYLLRWSGRNIDRGRRTLREPKIQNLDVAVGANHDVRGLQIAMYNSRTMRSTKCLKQLFRNFQTAFDGKCALEQVA